MYILWTEEEFKLQLLWLFKLNLLPSYLHEENLLYEGNVKDSHLPQVIIWLNNLWLGFSTQEHFLQCAPVQLQLT